MLIIQIGLKSRNTHILYTTLYYVAQIADIYTIYIL